MERIKIGTIQHNSGYFEFSATFIIDIPTKFSSLSNKNLIAQSYGYNIVDIDGTDYFTFSRSYSFSDSETNQSVKNSLVSELTRDTTELNNFELTDYDTLSGMYYDGTNWN